MDLKVTVRGPLFEKNISGTLKTAGVEEAIGKINDRLMRKGSQGSGGRGLGVRRNVVTARRDELVLRVSSTKGGKEHWPRMKGTTWQRKNIAITRAMAPRVLRAWAKRVAAELNA